VEDSVFRKEGSKLPMGNLEQATLGRRAKGYASKVALTTAVPPHVKALLVATAAKTGRSISVEAAHAIEAHARVHL
jgi:hypothetical protein